MYTKDVFLYILAETALIYRQLLTDRSTDDVGRRQALTVTAAWLTGRHLVSHFLLIPPTTL